MLRIYSVLISLIVWGILVPWYLGQILLFRGTWRELLERLGSLSLPKKSGSRRILIHGVSVGEMAVVEPIVRALLCKGDPLEIVLTTGNRDGKATADRMRVKYPEIKAALLLPWDRMGTMLAWMREVNPDLVAVVETEIWPSFFVACKRLGVPLCIVNGRIYPGDASRYRIARRFFSRILSCATWIGVQSHTERGRFLSMGAPPAIVEVVGNAKFDTASLTPKASDARLQKLESVASLLVGGSTHGPEERWLLEALLGLRKLFPGLRLILAPRHVNRCGAIARLAKTHSLRVTTWSSFRRDENDWHVLLIDELGWLSTIYAFADVVVIGGSFAPKGGHNPLEAAAHERAIVVGPHMENFQDIIEDFWQNNALSRLGGERELAGAIRQLLEDADKRRKIGARARSLLLSRQGAAGQYADALRERMTPPTAKHEL